MSDLSDMLRGQLADLDRSRADLGRDELPAGGRANLEALDMLRADLADELRDEEQPVLELLIRGAPVFGHSARVSAVTKLLGELNESISSVAQALTGKATTAGSIPLDILQATDMLFEEQFAASLGARLRAPAEPIEQLPLAGTVGTRRLLSDAVERVLEVLERSNVDAAADEDLLEELLPLGSRSQAHLLLLAQAVASTAAEPTLRWKPRLYEQREVTVTAGGARRLRDVLTTLTTRTERITVEGHLGTASDFRRYFELVSREGDVLRGIVAEDLVSELQRYFAEDVTATLDMTVGVSRASGAERRSYLLVGLASATQQTQIPTDGA